MTIVGVTDEPAAKIKSYIADQGIKYVIAIGGAGGYVTRGIPHAWLVSPKGEMVWEGHPGSLKDSLIEEHLRDVSLIPTFELPKELSSAQRQLSSGNFGSGLNALERYLKRPKDPEVEAAAKDAIEKIKKYGAEQLAQVEEYAKERDYYDGAKVLSILQKIFRGTEVADKAKATLAEWKKDSKIKVELSGGTALEKANALIQAKRYRNAASILLPLTKQKKYDGTKVQESAEERLAFVKRNL